MKVKIIIAILFLASMLSAQDQDFIYRIDHSPNSKTSGCSLYESLGHWYLRLPEDSHHHESCPHVECVTKRRAQFINDSLTIAHMGPIYKITSPVEIERNAGPQGPQGDANIDDGFDHIRQGWITPVLNYRDFTTEIPLYKRAKVIQNEITPNEGMVKTEVKMLVFRNGEWQEVYKE